MASRLTTLIVVLIVAGTLIAGFIVGAQREDLDGPIDLIITNGRVYTGKTDKLAEALAIRGNKILLVGSNREVKRLRRAQTTMVDAHGATVLPGFNDSHIHLLSGGLGFSELDLAGASTLDAVKVAISNYAAAHAEREWIIGRGWIYDTFEGLPTRQQLDALVPDRPAYLTAYDGHTGWANTAALKLAGITRKTRNPENGTIVKDPRSGEPSGALLEHAMDLIEPALPQPTREDQLRALRSAIAYAQKFGITSVQNASGSPDELDLYGMLRDSGELDLRVYNALSASPTLSEADIDRLDAVRKKYPDDPLLKAGAIKLIVDGVVESRTAALLAPYADTSTMGRPNYTPAELNRIVTMLDRRGWQVLIHAIGDRGVRMALDAFEVAQAANPPPPRGRRHRIEHIEIVDPADVPRFSKLGVIASMQPLHSNPAPDLMSLWMKNLGPERAARGWMYGTLQRSGARLAFGSDWPVVTLDPRLGLHVATTRTSPEGVPEGGWIPEERLTLPQAIDAYSGGAAFASFDDQRKGTLTPGMLADIVILTSDLFQPDDKLLDAQVAVTIFDGRVVYDREKDAAAPTTSN
jgi:predicted amidohydrolase YtcJ